MTEGLAAPCAAPLLDVRDLSAGYPPGAGRGREHAAREIVHGVTFSLQKGELACLMGANGCGKTTTLKAVMGLLPPLSGSVRLANQAIGSLSEHERARLFAYIPQVHRPPFPFSVADIVMMGRTPYLSRLSRPAEHDRRVAQGSLALLGLEDLASVPYTQLSGGQQQLVLIARALAQEADLLILDEPTAALDFGNQQLVLDCLHLLCQLGKTMLMVTHDPNQVLAVADRVIAMQEGRIIADGPARETITPALIEDLYHTEARIRTIPLDGDRAETICIPCRSARLSVR